MSILVFNLLKANSMPDRNKTIGRKNMKKKKRIQIGALFMIMLLLSMAFMPAISASKPMEVSDEKKGQVVKIDSPKKVEIIENTNTSTIVQVGDILITSQSDQKHTEAVLDIENLKTQEKKTLNYKISKDADTFTTEVYYEGKLANTFTTDYDPLEPHKTADVLEVKSTGESIIPYSAETSNYWWDNVNFTQGYGIKYQHPDYSYYGIEPWDECSLSGDELTHYHIADYTSKTIAELGPIAAGAAIGAYLGNVAGAAAGAVLGSVLSGHTSNALQDECGCIWFWYADDWDKIFVPVPPYLIRLPEYFRIAEYTLWDAEDIGNP